MIATEPRSSNELESSNGQKSAMTDGFHLLVDALKLNGIDTIYGVAGIPITDLGADLQGSGQRMAVSAWHRTVDRCPASDTIGARQAMDSYRNLYFTSWLGKCIRRRRENTQEWLPN
jgi:hypothetical protein